MLNVPGSYDNYCRIKTSLKVFDLTPLYPNFNKIYKTNQVKKSQASWFKEKLFFYSILVK